MISVDGIEIQLNSFPDGTLNMKAPTPRGTSSVFITWKYESDNELFALACLREKYSNRSAYLHMFYIPHARMDRVKDAGDVFTLKTFCNIINSMNFTKVVVMDAHSNVALALLNNVAQMDVKIHINEALELQDKGNTAIFFPDEGAMKRYTGLEILYPYAFGVKKRNWQDGKILSLDIIMPENIVGKDVLIVDDICSYGGTFMRSAEALIAAGAKSVSLYITHCENSILKGEIFNSGLFEQVYTTDSLVHCDELKEKIIYV